MKHIENRRPRGMMVWSSHNVWMHSRDAWRQIMYCIEASPAEEIERQMKAKLLTRACHMCVVRVVHLTASTRTAHFQRVVPCSRRSGTLNKALRGSATPAQAQGTRRRGPDLHPIRRDEGRRMRGAGIFHTGSSLVFRLWCGTGSISTFVHTDRFKFWGWGTKDLPPKKEVLIFSQGGLGLDKINSI